jgi:hypothetical protein
VGNEAARDLKMSCGLGTTAELPVTDPG